MNAILLAAFIASAAARHEPPGCVEMALAAFAFVERYAPETATAETRMYAWRGLLLDAGCFSDPPWPVR